MLRVAVTALLFACAATCVAQESKPLEAKLPLVDEGAGDATWSRFRARLLEALAKRDGKYVLAVVDPQIRNTTGKRGSAEFRKLWEPQSETSVLWVELPKVLYLGSKLVRNKGRAPETCAPYVYYTWPEQSNPDNSGAITAREALVKTRPATDSPTLRMLAYEVVTVLDWEVADEDSEARQKWVKVKTAGSEGYVPEEQIRSPLEYRACFVKGESGWRMTALEVGE